MVIAENILIMIPILSVMAKPLIVPEPSQNKTTAAINVVIFASNMVMYARLKPDNMLA